MNIDLRQTIQSTIERYISPTAEILSINDLELAYGLSAVALKRHEIRLRDTNDERTINLISKQATLIERRVLSHLFEQSANVPFSYTPDLISSNRVYLCMQDVDYETDYSHLNYHLLQSNELLALSHIHAVNYQKSDELSWLPFADPNHIEYALNEKWRPSWDEAKLDTDFISTFGQYISEVEQSAEYIVKDIQEVLLDQSSHTLIHNDLHPGNTLIYNNKEVYFIDWEEARYGSLYLDISLRFREASQAENYRQLVNSLGLNLSKDIFTRRFHVASRYMGLRYMSWFLQVWKEEERWLNELNKYLKMAIS
jgi:fructosamine-3-kinase